MSVREYESIDHVMRSFIWIYHTEMVKTRFIVHRDAIQECIEDFERVLSRVFPKFDVTCQDIRRKKAFRSIETHIDSIHTQPGPKKNQNTTGLRSKRIGSAKLLPKSNLIDDSKSISPDSDMLSIGRIEKRTHKSRTTPNTRNALREVVFHCSAENCVVSKSYDTIVPVEDSTTDERDRCTFITTRGSRCKTRGDCRTHQGNSVSLIMKTGRWNLEEHKEFIQLTVKHGW